MQQRRSISNHHADSELAHATAITEDKHICPCLNPYLTPLSQPDHEESFSLEQPSDITSSHSGRPALATLVGPMAYADGPFGG